MVRKSYCTQWQWKTGIWGTEVPHRGPGAEPRYGSGDEVPQNLKHYHGWRHGNGRYGHGHTIFSSTMATNDFGHSTFRNMFLVFKLQLQQNRIKKTS